MKIVELEALKSIKKTVDAATHNNGWQFLFDRLINF